MKRYVLDTTDSFNPIPLSTLSIECFRGSRVEQNIRYTVGLLSPTLSANSLNVMPRRSRCALRWCPKASMSPDSTALAIRRSMDVASGASITWSSDSVKSSIQTVNGATPKKHNGQCAGFLVTSMQ